MPFINVEIKARCKDHLRQRQFLETSGARLAGTDHQTDTYFRVSYGRLKLREGQIENNLIRYSRPDQQGPKRSDFSLVKIPDAAGLKAALAASCGILTVIEKTRQIWYIGNIKIHLDIVPGLGNFIEIEAFNEGGEIGLAELQQQCATYMGKLGISDDDLVAHSYSDLKLGIQ